jgi:DinB superfamily
MNEMRSPDPVDEPKAYQEHLLGLLGDDDPAEVQAGTPAAWRALVEEAADRVRERPEPAEWSVLECLGHAADAEIVYAGRYRWIVAHDEPPLIGYEQDLWVQRLHHRDGDPQRLLALLGSLREANLDFWNRSTPQERERVGLHSERGPESLDLSFRLIAGHDRFHLAQARRALDAVKG